MLVRALSFAVLGIDAVPVEVETDIAHGLPSYTVVGPPGSAVRESDDRIRAAVIDPVRSVITPDGWKFNCSPLGEHELYHLPGDPGETRNVFGANRALAGKLRDRIAAWQEQTGDAVAIPVV